MAKKHGFRGTPVRPSLTPSSVGGIFERRGDPMVSPREGREKFGRNLETENPDYDRYFTGLAHDLLKPNQVDKGNAFRKRNVREPSAQLEAAQIMQRMRKGMAKAEGKPIEYKSNKKESDLIVCPFACGYANHDSRKVSEHLKNTVRERNDKGRLTCKPKVV